MGRISDLQIELENALQGGEPVNKEEWTCAELTSMINEYKTEPGYEEVVGCLLRAKTILEDF
jgi:hypothetical protein